MIEYMEKMEKSRNILFIVIILLFLIITVLYGVIFNLMFGISHTTIDTEAHTFISISNDELVNLVYLSKVNNMGKSYNCVDYTNSLIKELRAKNVYSCVVYLEYIERSGSHNIVAVETTDGHIYIEPQTNQLFYTIDEVQQYYSKKLNTTVVKIVSCFESKSYMR